INADTSVTSSVTLAPGQAAGLTYALDDSSTLPAHLADFSFSSDGSFAYTPAPDYNGPDSFSVTASDSSFVDVSITVSPVNDPPVADIDDLTTYRNTPTSSNVVASDVDGDALTFSIVDAAQHG